MLQAHHGGTRGRRCAATPVRARQRGTHAAGTTLVVTNARPVNDPIVRITVQAGCESAVRREYTLFMDPPPIEAPLVAAESAPPETAQAPAACACTSRVPARHADASAGGHAHCDGIGNGADIRAGHRTCSQGRADQRTRCDESRGDDPRRPSPRSGRDFRCRAARPARRAVRPPPKQTGKGPGRNERMRSKPRRRSFASESWS